MVLVVFGIRMRDDVDLEEYARHSRRMRELVQEIPGFISIKGFVGEDGTYRAGDRSGAVQHVGHRLDTGEARRLGRAIEGIVR